MNTITLTAESPEPQTVTVYPNGDVSGCTNWTPLSGENYTNIDESVLDTYDYVSMATTAYTIDLYSLPATSETGTINYIKVYTYAWIANNPTTEPHFCIVCSPDSVCTNYYSSPSLTLTTSGQYFSKYWETNPETGNPWDWSDITTLAIGIRGKTSFINATEDVTIRPNSDGTYSDFRYCSSSPYYRHIDDVTPDDGDMICGSYGEMIHTFYFESVPTLPASSTINKVTLYARLKDNGKTYQKRLGWYDVGTDTLHKTYLDITQSFEVYSYELASNPSTSAPWTVGDLAYMQGGLEKRLQAGSFYHCSQVYAVVNYTYPTYPTIYSAQTYMEINYTPTSVTGTLNMPLEASIDHDRNVAMLNFWDGEREVYDLSRNKKTTIFRGMEFVHDSCSSPSTRISEIRELAKRGESLTISGMDMPCFNRTYKLLSFGWKVQSENPEVYEWILELEDTELI